MVLPPDRSPTQRLIGVRNRIRELALGNPTCANLLRERARKYQAWRQRILNERDDLERRLEDLVKKQLKSGCLAARTDGPILLHPFRGKCPPDIAEALRRCNIPSNPPPRELEALAAPFALAALEGSEHSADFTWRVSVPKPDDWSPPIDPMEMDADALQKLSADERLTVACAWLSGLADFQSANPIVPRTDSRADIVQDVKELIAWQTRVPPGWRLDANLELEEGDATIAEELLAYLENRVAAASPSNNNPRSKVRFPKTRRGVLHEFTKSAKDQLILAGLRENKSYRRVGRECGVCHTTVWRVAKAYGETGHGRDAVSLDVTIQENLRSQGRSRKQGSSGVT